jgi:histidine triad (HIT) family protein
MSEAPQDNVFARILRGELPCHRVYGNEETFAFLDIYPQTRGHTLVIPRNYSRNIVEASAEDRQACIDTVCRIAPVITELVCADGFSVVSNTGREAGQMIDYLHFHIIPRSKGDEINFQRLGVQEPPEVLEELAGQIRDKLGWSG